jgi:AmiR/NasT family two-component response regulator
MSIKMQKLLNSIKKTAVRSYAEINVNGYEKLQKLEYEMEKTGEKLEEYIP